jgi:hypothetical protein
MNTRNFAMIMGIAFLLIGILGFVPGITRMHADTDLFTAEGLRVGGPGHGMLLGLFHVNLLHNLVHVLFGIMGLAMARRYDTARLYARIVAVSYGLLVVLGLLPDPFHTLFGLVPIHGNDIWLHAIIALAAAYFGFVRPATEMPTDEYSATGTPRHT